MGSTLRARSDAQRVGGDRGDRSRLERLQVHDGELRGPVNTGADLRL
jgi:hypothetical protein